MRMFKSALAGAAAVSMIAATGAIAAGPAGSTASAAQGAPVSGVRAGTPLKRASHQSDGGSSPALGYGLAAVFAGGLVAATIAATDDDDSNTRPASPG